MGIILCSPEVAEAGPQSVRSSSHSDMGQSPLNASCIRAFQSCVRKVRQGSNIGFRANVVGAYRSMLYIRLEQWREMTSGRT